MLGPATIGELSGTWPRWRAARGRRSHSAAGRRSLRREHYTASVHANHFSYDAMLRRTAVEDSAGVRYFTWDTNGMNLLAERDATGTVVASYTHGRAAVDGIGSCVGQTLVQSGATYYEFDICDHRGSVVRRVNAAGQVTGYFEYDAWGNYLRDEETEASSRFRYQSNWIELKDSDGELYLSPTRVYHAGVGRFLGRDPRKRLGEMEGQYRYDTTCADPLGLCCPLRFKRGSAEVVAFRASLGFVEGKSTTDLAYGLMLKASARIESIPEFPSGDVEECRMTGWFGRISASQQSGADLMWGDADWTRIMDSEERRKALTSERQELGGALGGQVEIYSPNGTYVQPSVKDMAAHPLLSKEKRQERLNEWNAWQSFKSYTGNPLEFIAIKPDAEAAMYAAYHHQFISGFLVGKRDLTGSGVNPLYTPDVFKHGLYKIHVPCTLAIVDSRLDGPRRRRVVDQIGGTLILNLNLKAGIDVEQYIGYNVGTGQSGALTIDKWVRTGGE